MEKSQGRGMARWVPGVFVLLVSILLLICASQEAAAAVQHQVGGTPGWSVPSKSNVNYTTWASEQTFSVGDTLYFNYSIVYHNVLQVTKENYDNCSSLSPLTTWHDGETMVQLNSTGILYFICGFTGHCEEGQKVAVLVQAASSSSSSTPKSAAAPPSASTLLHLSPLLALSLIFVLHLLPYLLSSL